MVTSVFWIIGLNRIIPYSIDYYAYFVHIYFPKNLLKNTTIICTGIATMKDTTKHPSRNPINKYVPSIAVIIFYKLLSNSSLLGKHSFSSTHIQGICKSIRSLYNVSYSDIITSNMMPDTRLSPKKHHTSCPMSYLVSIFIIQYSLHSLFNLLMH